jgi:hypothetical protein
MKVYGIDLYTATKNKHNARFLSVSEKLVIIKKEQLSITTLKSNNIVCVLLFETSVYQCFLSGIRDVLESAVRNLWELENFTSRLFKTQEKQTKPDMFSKRE